MSEPRSLRHMRALAPHAFVQAAYASILGRAPTTAEASAMLSMLADGQSRAWLAGELRYSEEGRRRGADIGGLGVGYAAERLLRAPIVGPVLSWLDALMRLPQSRRRLRSLEAAAQIDRSRLEGILPPPLDDVMEVVGEPLFATARERFGVAPGTSAADLTPSERYAMFETIFYESPAVAWKQRVYTRYLNRDLAQRLPHLDLGCGRGEFLQILRGEGVASVGVDVNRSTLSRLRTEGFDVVESDLVAFLETDQRMYCSASLLQVAEHLTDAQLERVLFLIAPRLAAGAVFFVETPNPLSAFASAVFHTDSTHVRPLPPERLRYQVEAAGFEQSRTLYQARIPKDQFAGPDPRAYYMDYAIIASRSAHR